MKFTLLICILVALVNAQEFQFGPSALDPVTFLPKPRFNPADERYFLDATSGFNAADLGNTLDALTPARFPTNNGGYTAVTQVDITTNPCGTSDPQHFEAFISFNHPAPLNLQVEIEDPSGNVDVLVSANSLTYGAPSAQFDEDNASPIGGATQPQPNVVGLFQPVGGVFSVDISNANLLGTWTMRLTDPVRAGESTTGTWDTALIALWCNNDGTAQGDPHVVTLSGVNGEFDAEDGFYNLFKSEQTVVDTKLETMKIIGGERPAQYMSKVAVELNCGEEKVRAVFDAEGIHFNEGSESAFSKESCKMVSTSNPDEFHKDVSQARLSKFDFYENAHQVSFYTSDAQVFVFYTGHHYNVRVIPSESVKKTPIAGLLTSDLGRDANNFVVAAF